VSGTRQRRSIVANWAELSDEDLLKLRICDLGLEIAGTELEGRIQRLYAELEQKDLHRFRPRIYLGDEWFSPDGVPSISIPFFLAHPRLKALEKKFMLEVEGGTEEWCLKLLRHECGHSFDHAYRISRKRTWKELFGSPSGEYDPDTYRPRPYSKSYVLHIDNWYSQSHPSEDFAETFAVWLNPNSNWQGRYARWAGALEKLQYVDRLARKYGGQDPSVVRGPHTFPASRMKMTLDRFYKKKIRLNRAEYPDFFDVDLKNIFDGEPQLPKKDFGAASFLRRNRPMIVTTVSRWTGEKKYTINSLVKKLTVRCEQVDLRLGKTESQTNLEVAAYLATLVTHYLFTGQFKRTV
jgi:hypothetical protein